MRNGRVRHGSRQPWQNINDTIIEGRRAEREDRDATECRDTSKRKTLERSIVRGLVFPGLFEGGVGTVARGC